MYVSEAQADPSSWWKHYRAAWCLNRLDQPDSARCYARRAFYLAPGEEKALSELMRSLASEPESVLTYSHLVSGGGVCRYRLARAELDLNRYAESSIQWLTEASANSDSAKAADACCWLWILTGRSDLELIEKASALAPDEEFYRGMLVEALVDSEKIERAASEFERMTDRSSFSYWSTASELHWAEGLHDLSVDDCRKAFNMRQIPSTAADLGWRLYFRSRELIEAGSMQKAEILLRECSGLWSAESSWALRADSLINSLNEFTSVNGDYGEPF
ncbi:hypothetical protein CSA37_04630 [Candidatus Fermentibacteria bacterium]|nr:MAG: hypothetical protein CSA37_06980 [Candidatus Fermentibacteria bacterium]PIE52934.1 MAG: hypothetical protein CSA37_04630 [Candidatus Fermentibacteria bacterium]